ncbi:head-tail connector protein [Sphingobium sp. Z007]|uniref:head-tail connector protein n=1 Tax=Sphingobium sp. Z007 TaxID=627495 RepID=UPI000B49955F|nr:phage head-tail connector protein [Sphingobium sp. Z007]
MVEESESGALAASLAELKAYLRIETGAEDAVLAGLLRSAAALCEQFIGQWLIVRDARETVAGDGGWQRLSARPVAAITAVEAVDADGVAEPLPVDAYAIDIDAAGDGWVRSTRAGDGRRLAVRYQAGLAAELNGLPEALRQGIVRLAAEHFVARGGESAPPAVVSALWRPFRRMRLA